MPQKRKTRPNRCSGGAGDGGGRGYGALLFCLFYCTMPETKKQGECLQTKSQAKIERNL